MKASINFRSCRVRRWLTCLVLVGAISPSAVAGSRTSTNYKVPADTVDSGGRHTASAAYSNDGSIGIVAGISTAGVLGLAVRSGYVAQLFDAVPVITSTLTASGTYGSAISTYTITATNSPVGYNATGLPAGLSVNTATGAITGTPTAAGTFSVVLGATNSGGTGTATLTLTIAKATATVTIGNLSAVYDGAAKHASATTTPSGLAVGFTYDGSVTAPKNAGSYAVVATISDANHTGSASGTLVIARLTPVIYWTTPNAITYGTALSGAQLSATANVIGSMVYSPASGAVLNAGSQTLNVTFTPNNSANFNNASAQRTLTVNPAIATITLGSLSAVYDGTAKSATASTTPGGLAVGFTYAGSATAPINAGSFAVVATISDANHTGSASGTLIIAKATPVISWVAPAAITYGTALDGTQLNATANVTGSMVYSPASGAVLDVGSQTLTVTFTATDSANYNGASAQQTLLVTIPDYTGTYFGNFDSGGNWAFIVGSDNTGTFLASLPASSSAIVTPVTIDPDGSFSTVASPAQAPGSGAAHALDTFMLTGKISGSSITGQIAGLGGSFSGTEAPASGPTEEFAGLYTATALDAATGTIYAVIGADGQALVVAVMPTLVTGGAGTVNAAGELTVTLASGTLDSATINAASGNITATIIPPDAAAPVNFAGVAATVTPVSRLVNLSTRGYIGTGDSIMIAGFVIAGTGTTEMLVRAVGPTLGDEPFNVNGAIADPQLVIKCDHIADQTCDNWGAHGDQQALLEAFTCTGAFAIPAGSKDAALCLALPAGSYTALVSGVSASTGVSIVELYTVGDEASARLVNISTRAFVGTGDAVMIPGFVAEGNAPHRYLVRGIGPSLSSPPFNVTGVLADPVLTVVLAGTSDQVATNDDWDANGSGDALIPIMQQTGAFELPRGSRDAALVLNVPPHVGYTIIISGKGGATGVVLAEVYELP